MFSCSLRTTTTRWHRALDKHGSQFVILRTRNIAHSGASDTQATSPSPDPTASPVEEGGVTEKYSIGSNSGTSRNEISDPSAHSPSGSDKRASSKLFADAAREEFSSDSASPTRRKPAAIRGAFAGPDQPWTGDESMQDAVLRMLVDKYKPLRGEFVTADERLKRAPPSVSSSHASTLQEIDSDEDLGEAAPLTAHLAKARAAASESTTSTPGSAFSTPPPPSGALANVPLLPSIEGHRPWHTTYVAPKHAASIKLGRIIPSSSRPSTATVPGEQPQRKDVEKLRRRMQAVRLTSAREGTLDYKLGLRREGSGSGGGRGESGPPSLRAWNSLVEERIEKARRDGKFAKITGRGAPLARSADEGNPFIAREEFLMNRIVQRQGAAPPWVEVQGELDSALTSFRSTLRTTWARQALRNLTRDTPPALLPALQARMTLENAAALRDPAWIEREKGYHIQAIGEINALVRKYNGLAPAAVRRGYYGVEAELDRAYKGAAEDVLGELQARVNGVQDVGSIFSSTEKSEVRAWDGMHVGVPSLTDMWKGWWGRLFKRRS